MSADHDNRTKKGWGTIPRRTFLKGAATVAGAASLGGIPGIVAAGQAPAYPKGTKLHLLTRINFIPAGDTLFSAQAEEFGKQMGVVETYRFEPDGSVTIRTYYNVPERAEEGIGAVFGDYLPTDGSTPYARLKGE